MLEYFDKMSVAAVVVGGGFLILAPFFPEPHIIEKTRMLLQGDLKRPIDIFDLFWHAWPIPLVALKLWRTYGLGMGA